MGNSASHKPRLIRVDSKEREIYPIHEGVSRIGRSRGFEICLEDTTVSRFHCYLLREGAAIRLFDGECKNPILLDGQPTDGNPDGHPLRSGHSLKLGRCEFVYEGPVGQAPRPVAATSVPRSQVRHRAMQQKPSSAARRSSQGTPLVPIAVCCAIGLALIVAILARSLPRPEPGKGADSVASARQLRFEESQQRIDQILAELKIEKISSEEAARVRSQLKAEMQRNVELMQDLQAERDRNQQRSVLPAAAPSAQFATGPGDGVGILFPELDSAAEIQPVKEESKENGSPSAVATGTVTVTTTKRSIRRSSGEIQDLVQRLTNRIDDYGTHLILPATLEPDLTELSSSAGQEAATGVIQVYEHVRSLLRQTDASIELNEKRKTRLLHEAEQTTPQGTPLGGSDMEKELERRKRYPKEKRGVLRQLGVGPEAETNQRRLEAFETAAEIHRQHRVFLVALRGAVLESLVRFTDAEALAYLRQRFSKENDLDLLKAMLKPFEKAGSTECVPILLDRMGSSNDAGLRDAIHRSLVTIAGRDLGDKPSLWAGWWARGQRE